MSDKVLLVDDVTMFLELQQGFLKHSSVRTFIARDGVEALEVVKREQPSLIFMDLHMPRMNGAECCSHLKADPVYRKLPVVMITAEGKDDDQELCRRAGCDEFLTKPLDRHLFLNTARKYLPSIDRRNTRVPCRTKVKFRAFGVTLTGETCDLSEHGMYLATDYEVQEGGVIEVVFTLPDAKGSIIQARGRVAWLNLGKQRRKLSQPSGFGVEFIAMDDSMQGVLSRFVAGTK